jgi:hypothetical protein
MFESLDTLVESENWSALEQAIQDDYAVLLEHTQSPHCTDCLLLATALYECFKHSRDRDFRMSLAIDFGNFISLTLEVDQRVVLWNHACTEAMCAVCILPQNEDESLFGVYHRHCGGFLGHPNCLDKWARPVRCPSCNTTVSGI